MVNARIEGQLSAEVQDLTTGAWDTSDVKGDTYVRYAGNTYPHYTKEECNVFEGDSINQEIRWKGGELSRFKGSTIRLRFYLTHGELYSFWIGEQ